MDWRILFTEWADFLIRWVHVITGICWIGSSFYFVHLDLSLQKRDGLPSGVGGEAWQVHGGGFYNMMKYTVAPSHLPQDLTWFKWEAYWTSFQASPCCAGTISPMRSFISSIKP